MAREFPEPFDLWGRRVRLIALKQIGDITAKTKTPECKRGRPPSAAAISLPFPKRNVISAEIKTKAKTNLFWGNLSAIYLSAWAFKDARVIRHNSRQRLTFTEANKLQRGPSAGERTSRALSSTRTKTSTQISTFNSLHGSVEELQVLGL